MPKVLKKQKTRILKVRVAGHWTLLHFLKHVLGAGSRNRTGTLFPARDFESRASTYSAIPATRDELSLICHNLASFMLGVCFTPALNILEGTASSARNGVLQLAPSCAEEWRAVIDSNLPSAFLAAK